MNSEGIFNQDTFINYVRKSRWASWQPHHWEEEGRNRWTTSFTNMSHTHTPLLSLHLHICPDSRSSAEWPRPPTTPIPSASCRPVIWHGWQGRRVDPSSPGSPTLIFPKDVYGLFLGSTDLMKASTIVSLTPSFCWNCDIQAATSQWPSQECGCVQ